MVKTLTPVTVLVLHVSACGASTLLPVGDRPNFFSSQIGHCNAYTAPRDIVFTNSVCLSVCLSVDLSNAGTVSERMGISSYFLTVW